MSLARAEYHNLAAYVASSRDALAQFRVFTAFSPIRFLHFVFNVFYILVQALIIFFFKPHPPRKPEHPTKPHGRIAVIGAGLTGVSSAAHAIAHGFDVVIYEKGDRVGGIWTHVNSTSGLQLNSMLYRFHPGVLWSRAFPLRDEILGEVERVWKEYKLEPRTRFNTPVRSVRRAGGSGIAPDGSGQNRSKWIVNEGDDGLFDAVIVTVGTCGEPRMVHFEGMPAGVSEGAKEKEPEKQNGDGKPQRNGRYDSETSSLDQESPVRKHGHSLNGSTSSVWTEGKGESPSAVRRDQESKKDAGFLAPAEAYPTTPSDDPQKGTKAKSLLEETQDSEGSSGGEDMFSKGPVVHSSQLDKLDADHVKGKTVIVIGSGASGVEAVETALAKGAQKTIMVARDDKWIIPRNVVLDTLIAAQPFGRQMPLSFIWEAIIVWWSYHGLMDLVPAALGLFEGTPIVNDDFLHHVRNGRCDYVRGDTQRFTKNGVRVNVRARDSKPGDPGEDKEFDGDVIVLATGYKKPEIGFLDKSLFPEDFERPNLYLQNFSTEDWSILMTNSAYLNAIGTVGHFHIGIYTRILLTFIMDENTRPSPKDMKLWVNVIRFLKKGAKGGALGFFTYMELTLWLVVFHVFRVDRIRWTLFIMQGWGVTPAEYVC